MSYEFSTILKYLTKAIFLTKTSKKYAHKYKSEYFTTIWTHKTVVIYTFLRNKFQSKCTSSSRNECFFHQNSKKLPQKYKYANFSTTLTNLTKVTPKDLHIKFQSNRTSGFREEDFLTKNSKNCPKNTNMQISAQF